MNGGLNIMKKIISFFIAAIMTCCLCLPAFAAQSATFAVNVVSEDNSKAVVSIDYEGGAAFNCLDFEIKLSSKVSVEKSATGAGLRNFKIYTEDTEGGAVLTSFNKDVNPMMFTFASISGFKAVNGKDLLVLTLKKTSADKLKADDVKLNVTNCGLSGTTASDIISVKPEVIQIGGSATVKTSAAAGQVGTTAAKTTAQTTKAGETTASTTTTATGNSELNGESTTAASETTTANSGESSGLKTTDKKKIVIVGAAALIVLALIVVGVVVIAKKAKKEDIE